jgi:hypothetical protein
MMPPAELMNLHKGPEGRLPVGAPSFMQRGGPCSAILLPISTVPMSPPRCSRRWTVARRFEQRSAAAAMVAADFAAGAVRDFVDRADDEHWAQLVTIMRKAEDPGLAAIQAILGWVAGDA